MFQTGDIVDWSEDPTLWVIIEQDFLSDRTPNAHLWRMRRRDDQIWQSTLIRAPSDQLSLVNRPLFLESQELKFRQYFVRVIEDFGPRVHCKITGISDYKLSKVFYPICRGKENLHILKSSLVEWNIYVLVCC